MSAHPIFDALERGMREHFPADGSEGPSEAAPLAEDAKAAALICLAWAGCIGALASHLFGEPLIAKLALAVVLGGWLTVATWPETRA